MTRTALSIPAVLALLLCTSAARADDDERDYPHITAASPQGADLVIDGASFGVRAPEQFSALLDCRQGVRRENLHPPARKQGHENQ